MHLQSISPAASPWSSGAMGMAALGAGEGQQVALQTVASAGSILSGTAPLWTASTALVIPVIGAAVAGVTLGLVALFSRKGPKQKVATTQIANEVAAEMEKNKAAYFAGPRTVSSQAQALANFDALWAYLEQNCGDPEMGDPGQRCVSERTRGGIYDMAAGNRDPIANDPNVQPDPTILSEAGETVSQLLGGGTSGSGGILLLGGAALLLALAFSGGGGK